MFDLAMVFAAVGVIGAGLYYWKQKLFQWRWMLWVPVVLAGLHWQCDHRRLVDGRSRSPALDRLGADEDVGRGLAQPD